MQIGSVNQIPRILEAHRHDQSGKNIPHRQDAAMAPSEKTYDFNNISPSEISELVRSGDIDLEHFILALPEGGIDLTNDVRSQMSEASHKKIDFIGLVEKQISYRSSENMPVGLHYSLLKSIQSLHGMPMNGGVDEFV